MNISKKLKEKIAKDIDDPGYEYALKLIENRDLSDKMNSDLKNKNEKKRKAKL